MEKAKSESVAGGRTSPSKRTTVSLAAAQLLGSAGSAEDAGAVLALGQCQRLLKQRLSRLRLDLFPDLTGLRLLRLVARAGGWFAALSSPQAPPISQWRIARNTQHASRILSPSAPAPIGQAPG